MEADSLASLRNEILDALDKSLSDFAAEAELETAQRQNANATSRVNWVMENGRNALRDLKNFFAETNVKFYSEESIPSYIWISCIFKDADSVNRSCSLMKTLEEFWLAKDIIQWGTRPENVLCIFAKSDSISPQIEGWKNIRRFLNQELPPPEAICRSAVIALLFLLKIHLKLTAPDLQYLIAEALGDNELCHRPRLLCELTEDLCVDTDFDAPWHSVASAAVLPTPFSRSSTKTLTFPGKLPVYHTTYNYMDIYQPHGSRPAAKSSCVFWGAWRDQGTWRSVASFSSLQAAELYQKCLLRANTSPSELSMLLSSHWINLLRNVYQLGINDGRLIIRNAATDIEELRYSNSAKTRIGSANVCLMYLNHFEYFKRMTKALCEEVERYPPQWQCPDAADMALPDWIQEAARQCDTLHKEVLTVTGEAREVRKPILEQHSLLESRKTNLLTILASIFIPMSFVATFFGMNTREINGSSWQLKYYFAAAIPLAVLTVLLPLIILPAFNFARQHLAAHSMLRGFLRWSLIVTTFVLNLYSDIMAFVNTDPNPTLFVIRFFLLIPLFALSIQLILSRFLTLCRSAPERSPILHLAPFLKEEKLRLMFFALALGCFVTSFTLCPFIELLPYFIYFFSVFYRNWKRKKSQGKEL